MSRAPAFAQAAADHRDAVEAAALAIAAVDPSAWSIAPREGKWTPAEIALHLILAYDPCLSELSGGAGFSVRVPWWKRWLVRWRFLPGILRGEFPPGAPAPREIRPRGEAPQPQEAIARLRGSAALFESRLAQARAARRVRLTHAYFGKLTPTQILKLLSAHAYHHSRQFPAGKERRP